MWQQAVRSPRKRKVCLVQNSEEPQDLRRHQERTIRNSSPWGSRPRKKHFYEEKVIKSTTCYLGTQGSGKNHTETLNQSFKKIAGDISKNNFRVVSQLEKLRLQYCILRSEIETAQARRVLSKEQPDRAVVDEVKGKGISRWERTACVKLLRQKPVRQVDLKTGRNEVL